jgi:DNA-binding transcriptional LysR family regulator
MSMRIFVRVVDEGSFAAAARAVDFAPAVVTRLVADLEAHLGVRLLQRSTRRIALTSAGEQYLSRTRAILADIEETEALASTSTERPSGRVRVFVPPSFSFHQLVKHLPRFRAQYPDIAIDLSSTGLLDVADEAYDVSILLTRGELQSGDFIARRLASSQVLLCAAPSYLARRGTPKRATELAQHDSLVLNAGGQSRTWSAQTWSLRPDDDEDSEDDIASIGALMTSCAMSAQHADTVFGAALAGLGIAALPSFVVEGALANGSLVRLLKNRRMSALTVYAAMPTRKYVPVRTKAFMDFLVETFASPKDPWLKDGS